MTLDELGQMAGRGLAVLGALCILTAVALFVPIWRQERAERRARRTASASAAQLRAEDDARFREIIAREFPTPWDDPQ